MGITEDNANRPEPIRHDKAHEPDIQASAREVVSYALEHGIIEAPDCTWAYNTLLDAAGDDGCAASSGTSNLADAARVLCHSTVTEHPGPSSNSTSDPASELHGVDAALERLARAAHQNGHLPQNTDGADASPASALLTLIMPRPSQVTRTFYERYAQSPRSATDWFYELSRSTGYVREAAIARNIKWTSDTRWGDLEITINLSKPEKDPRAIAAAGRATAEGRYPACALCMENEGYAGRSAAAAAGPHPDRRNLRIVPLELGGERWGLQYSPYAYFPEHCIVMSAEHRPMHIDRSTFARLLEFADQFPHYFIGSNADLPIVGGSILSHDHFQGGRHVFPMQKAPIAKMLSLEGFPDVRAGLVKWPLTVLRLSCRNARELTDAAVHVLEIWCDWDDPQAGIVSHDALGPHNTITPIARSRGGEYTLDLALRCNITDETHPLGVFHPRPELHHIKKENIGLIEVMGLAILPGRLARELSSVERTLLAGYEPTEQNCGAHAEWARELRQRHPDFAEGNAGRIICDEVARVFAQVLEDAGVFKWDAPGRAALNRFLDAL